MKHFSTASLRKIFRKPENQLPREIVGKTFFRLTVMQYVGRHKKSGRDHWLCRCSCEENTLKVVGGKELLNGNTRSCGCLQREIASAIGSRTGKIHQPRAARVSADKRKRPAGESNFSHLIRQYRRDANKRNLRFELSEEECRIFFKSDCYYCGSSPTAVLENPGSHGAFVYNGIDRRNSNLGYVPSNCVSACFACNLGKFLQTEEEFYVWIAECYRTLHAPKETKVNL